MIDAELQDWLDGVAREYQLWFAGVLSGIGRSISFRLIGGLLVFTLLAFVVTAIAKVWAR